jgi:hypothetical protein
MLIFSSATTAVTSRTRPSPHGDREGLLIGRAPVDRDQPLALLFPGDAAAVLTVDRDALAAGDVADDGVARYRIAATCQASQQIADAEHP